MRSSKRGNPPFAVQQHNDDIGIFDGLKDLKANSVRKRVPFGKAAGIYEGKLKFIPGRVPVMPVTGNPGKIIHQCVSGSGDPIKKCGFADIGTADDGNNGFHDKFDCIKFILFFKTIT
jgi:hypothetical protein